MLKEQVAEILRHFDKHEIGFQEHTINESVRQILNLFKAEVDKLTVINQAETTKIIDKWLEGKLEARHTSGAIAEAQLQHDKQTLLDLMGE